MKRKPLRIKKREIPFWRSAIFFPFLLFCIGVGGFWYAVAYSGLFAIQDISVQGTKNVSPEQVLQIAKTAVQSSSLADTMLFFPAEKVSDALSASFPEIKLVAVQRDFFQKSVILKVTEREAVALLCLNLGSCVAIDKEGIAIRKEDDKKILFPDGNRNSFPLFLSSQTENPALGERVFDESLLMTLLSFKRDLESQNSFLKENLSIFSFTLSDPKKVEARFSEGWVSFINPQEDMGWQNTKLMQVLEKQIPQANRKNLEYIDVRFGDQAYVKYRY